MQNMNGSWFKDNVKRFLARSNRKTPGIKNNISPDWSYAWRKVLS